MLTMRKLNAILQTWRISISPELKKKLLEEYRNPVLDTEGHLHNFTEQDICEQLRKRLLYDENFDKEMPALL
jgi:hypothetical protein